MCSFNEQVIKLWLALDGYKSYIGAGLMILLGVLIRFNIAHPEAPTSGFDSGVEAIRGMLSSLLILLGFTLVFIKIGQKSETRKIIAAIKGDSDEE